MPAAIPVTDEALLAVAREAAGAAAAQLLEHWEQPVEVQTKSTLTDPVSAADLAAEGAIRAVLARERPGDAILGEEGGLTQASVGAQPTGLRWVVDPLDGTVNYLYGIPQFAVSVAVEYETGARAGVVLDPVGGECVSATRSGPLALDRPGRPTVAVRPRGETRLAHALLATGFGYDTAVRAGQGEVIARVLPRVRDIRRAGAAALDLCAVALGRVDAYFERGVKPWDVAAGLLFCERAGLAIHRLDPLEVRTGDAGSVLLPAGVLVAPEAFADELLALVSGPTRDGA